MASPDIANVIKVPGRLSHSPTDLSLPYPHGGTAIGTCGRPMITPRNPAIPERAEEFGGSIVDLISTSPDWFLTVRLREVLDAAALAAVFPIYAAGAKGGPTLVSDVDSSVRAGARLGATLGLVLVFTPDSPDEHPWLLCRRAVPAIDETVQLAFRGPDEVNIGLVWYLTPDSSGRQFAFGLRRDLTL